MPTLPRSLGAALFAAAACFGSPAAFADGDVHEQLARIDQQIAVEPLSEALFLRRAELQRIHREWDAADLDYAQVLKLNPGHRDVAWQRARSWLEAGKPAPALPELERYVAQFPDHAVAQLTRARTLVALGRSALAVPAYATALERLPQPTPDHFWEQWNAQRDAGHPSALQLAALEQGLRVLGPVPILEEAALEVEVRAKQWDAALARLERQAAAAARKERWHYKRGLVLAEAARNREAAIAFRASLEEIEKLPPSFRDLRVTQALAAQVRRELGKLGVGLSAVAEAKL